MNNITILVESASHYQDGLITITEFRNLAVHALMNMDQKELEKVTEFLFIANQQIAGTE